DCPSRGAIVRDAEVVDAMPVAASPVGTKPCKYCGEPIAMIAKKCKHCNEYQEPAERVAAAKREELLKGGNPSLTGGEIALCIFCSGIACIYGIVLCI